MIASKQPIAGAEVTAITISPAQYAIASGRIPRASKPEDDDDRNPRFLLGDWLENDLPAEGFDSAIAIESSEHKPACLRFLLDRHAPNRVFALTTVRLWIAFRTGAMRFAVFTLRR